MSDTKFITLLGILAFVVWKLHNLNINVYLQNGEGVELDEDVWGG